MGGVLYLTNGDVVWEFFRVRLGVSDVTSQSVEELCKSIRIEPMAQDLLDWGIDEGQADNMIALARAEARR